MSMIAESRESSQRSLSFPGHVPGEVGVWIFIFGDMLVFALLFGVFVFYRADDPQLYLQSQATLNQHYGAVNTLFLLLSSWCVFMAVDSIREGRRHLAPGLFIGAMACGVAFSIVKIVEFSEKIGSGITLLTNDFYMFYFMLTGLHFLHLIIGMGVLIFLWTRARAPTPAQSDIGLFESGASYWHMVDLLWIVLFPLIYLMK